VAAFACASVAAGTVKSITIRSGRQTAASVSVTRHADRGDAGERPPSCPIAGCPGRFDRTGDDASGDSAASPMIIRPMRPAAPQTTTSTTLESPCSLERALERGAVLLGDFRERQADLVATGP
jgi:hypothetical protein